jgi:hypothetical protein
MTRVGSTAAGSLPRTPLLTTERRPFEPAPMSVYLSYTNFVVLFPPQHRLAAVRQAQEERLKP